MHIERNVHWLQRVVGDISHCYMDEKGYQIESPQLCTSAADRGRVLVFDGIPWYFFTEIIVLIVIFEHTPAVLGNARLLGLDIHGHRKKAMAIGQQPTI